MTPSKWRAYFTAQKKCIALSKDSDLAIDYGDIIYTSPEIDSTRWIVSEFKGEYNVFVDNFETRSWGASFSFKEKAMAFALKMVLVYSGKIIRKDRHTV